MENLMRIFSYIFRDNITKEKHMLGRILSAMLLGALATFFVWLFVGSGHEEQLRQTMLASTIAFFVLSVVADIFSD